MCDMFQKENSAPVDCIKHLVSFNEEGEGAITLKWIIPPQ